MYYAHLNSSEFRISFECFYQQVGGLDEIFNFIKTPYKLHHAVLKKFVEFILS